MRLFVFDHARRVGRRRWCGVGVVLWLLVWCLSSPVAAEVGTVLVSRVADNGQIMNGIVTALAQDGQGFVWIGTQFGLLRFDGYHFRKFVLDPATAGSNQPGGMFVRRLWVAPDGRLWVGTNTDGAAVMDPRTERFTVFAPAPNVPGRLTSGRVDAFAADGRGGVWIGSNDGLYHWAPGSHALDRRDNTGDPGGSLSDPHVRALLLDAHNTLWVGTWDGLSRLPYGSGRFERVGGHGVDHGPLGRQEIWALAQDAAGRVWWGGRTLGAGWVDPTTGEIHTLPLGTPDGVDYPWVAGLTLAHDGLLWLGTYGGGVDVVDPSTQRVIQHFRHREADDSTLAADTIGALLADRSGLMWIGGWGGGLAQVNTRNHAFRMLRHVAGDPRSLSFDNVFSLLALDDRRVWVGTDGNGIDVLDLQDGVVGGIRADPKDPHGLPDGHVISLARSADGTIWVGTRQAGLLSYDLASRRFTRWPILTGHGHAQIQRLLVAPDGRLWIGTDSGLLMLDPRSGQTRSVTAVDGSDESFSESINPMALTTDGTLWMGTDNGLFALPSGSDRLVEIRSEPGHAGSLTNNDVNGLVVDPKGRLWIATAQGIDQLVSWNGRSARFASLNARLGQPAVPLASNLTLDNAGRLWDLGTMIDPDARTLDQFDRPEGFDVGGGWIGAYARTPDGRLLFGGPQGLLVVHPEAFERWNYDPPVAITALLVDGQARPAAGVRQLTLAPTARGFSVEFAALDYSDPASLHYAYRLDGFDPDWMQAPVERRIATFTNLDPGRYVLRVKGTNRVGQWSPDELALVVDVEPAFYETLWFRVLVAALVALGLYALYLVRVRQLRRRARGLENLVRERTASLAQANAELVQLSRTDTLTQLPNRRAFLEAATGEIERMQRSGKPLSIVLGDIDRFKSINDTHGHEAGDAVLKAVAAILRGSIRAQDTVARWGGEEVIFLLPETDPEAALGVVEKWRRAIEAAELWSGDIALHVTMTFGVSQVRPGESVEQGAKRADEALYVGKDTGRNKVVLHRDA